MAEWKNHKMCVKPETEFKITCLSNRFSQSTSGCNNSVLWSQTIPAVAFWYFQELKRLDLTSLLSEQVMNSLHEFGIRFVWALLPSIQKNYQYMFLFWEKVFPLLYHKLRPLSALIRYSVHAPWQHSHWRATAHRGRIVQSQAGRQPVACNLLATIKKRGQHAN